MSIPMPSPRTRTSRRAEEDVEEDDQHNQHHDIPPPTERNDSSSTTDSGLSMDSLNDSLPSLSTTTSPSVNNEQDEEPAYAIAYHDDAAVIDSATGKSKQQPPHSTTGTTSMDRFADMEGDAGVDKYANALRRYSCDVAAHTAHMFESYYGGEIDSSSATSAPNNTKSPEKMSSSGRSSSRN